jgi:hypothetical protein
MIDGCSPKPSPVVHGFAGVANVTSGDEDALVSAGLLVSASLTNREALT